MAFTYTKGISPQGMKLYQLLLTQGPLSAEKIAEQLHLAQPAVYRLATYLVHMGVVEEFARWPKTFQALPVSEGKENYLAYQRMQFNHTLSPLLPTNTKRVSEDYYISFIQGREEIFQKVADDLDHAQKEAKFIVLGLSIGVSPELLLAQKNAVDRGVSIKIIAQEFTKENRETLKSWKAQGLDVRVGTPIGFHLLLIDDSISYLMYYDSQDKTKRYAVRVAHEAINNQFQTMFHSHWKNTKPLKI